MVKVIGLDARGIRAAKLRGRLEEARSPKKVTYSAKGDGIEVLLPTGARLLIPRRLIVELRGLPPSALKRIRLTPHRSAVTVPGHDIYISSMGLVRDFALGGDPFAIAGATRSPAKAAAARLNGKKGGRPKVGARRERSQQPA